MKIKRQFLDSQRGFVLIFALWVLAFLTVLAVGLAAGVRQKIVLLEKLDQRSRMNHLLEGAVKYTTVYISDQLSKTGGMYTTDLKMNLHNNSEFGDFELMSDHASISYSFSDQGEFYGVIDEERKINLNFATPEILTRLIQRVLGYKIEQAQALSRSLLDWRQYGESEIHGFFSDEYYRNLKDPYPKKDANYEMIEEILLVKGVTKEIYDQLIPYVTIYGEGKVNINTASAEVLWALGLDESVIEKILQARQGKDGLDATADDHIFSRPYDVATETNAIIKLLPADIRAIDFLNQKSLISTTSYYFTINVKGQLSNNSFSKTMRAIISSRENKIICWQER